MTSLQLGTNFSSTPLILLLAVAISICLVIHVLYILLLISAMRRQSQASIWKKPINIMILTDEGVRLLGSLGSLQGTYSAIFIATLSQSGKTSESTFIGNSSTCLLTIQVGAMGILWNVIGGTGNFIEQFIYRGCAV